MKRSEAEAIISAFVSLREMATDEQALAFPVLYPTWREGASYATGARVQHDGVLYKVMQDHDAQAGWTPDSAPSLFAEVLIPDADVIPEWVQPDSTNAYMAGDKVTHGGSTWVSSVDNNVWEPGVYGWEIA